MDIADLQALVAQGESDTLEFKRSTGQLREGMRTICAFLNGMGGYLFFGVTDNGEIVGQQVSHRTLESIATEIRKIEPSTVPDTEVLPLASGRSVIIIRTPSGSGPYTYDGRPFRRIGPTTSQMPVDLYRQRILETTHSAQRWENKIAAGLTVSDLNEAEIVRTLEEAIRRGRMDDPGTRDPEEILMGLGLVNDGDLLNAGVVLFGRSERLISSYQQCLLRMARFRGSDKSEFLDNRQEIGNAFERFVRAQRFMRDHPPVAGRVVPSLFERADDPLYPPEALREALANALCHRDYSVPGGAVSIAIYDDRLEISSTGQLPFGLTPDDLKRPHQSRPWNPLVAQAFFRRGIIESWGRGTVKMIELTERAGLTAPQFESIGGEVTVTFFPTDYVPPTRIGHDLSPLQQELLEVIAQSAPVALKEVIAGLTKAVPERTVQDNLRLLRQFGLIDVQGRGRGARWTLTGP